jgi:nicotinamidase-related amidase
LPAALLLMDFQAGMVSRLGGDDVVAAAGTALAAAREPGVLVVFVRVAFRKGYPVASPRNRSWVLTEKVFPRQAAVTTVIDWVAGVAGSRLRCHHA